MKMERNDFETILLMLNKCACKYTVEPVDGEFPCICCPSPYPENYTTGVTFSFNDDGSLYSVHSYEPDED